jgi:hypothetical protein
MRRQEVLLLVAVTLHVSTDQMPRSPDAQPQVRLSRTAAAARLHASYARRTLVFERNEGQADPSVSYLARASSHAVYLTKDAAVLSRSRPEGGPEGVTMSFTGARDGVEPVGEAELPGTVNYFIGNDPRHWRTDVKTFSRVRRSGIYPGIDVVYYGSDNHLEYDFIVSPEGRVADIRVAFDGAEFVRVSAEGELILQTPSGELRQKRPTVYQDSGGVRTSVDGKYVVLASGEVGFEVGAYDRAQALVIDPVLSYSTYLEVNQANDVAVDGQGFIYITGTARAAGLDGGGDVYVTKLTPDGGSVVFSSFFGGNTGGSTGVFFGTDVGTGIAVDSTGGVHVCGYTFSANFPIVNPFQAATPADPNDPFRQIDGFALKLSAQGNTLLYSTYLGGSRDDIARAIAIDPLGNAYIAGDTTSTEFPLLNPLIAVKPRQPGFVTKLNVNGQGVFSTYLGWDLTETVADVAADGMGNVYVTGATGSTNFPAVGAFQAVLSSGAFDAFVIKLSPDGQTILYSTYLGGAGGQSYGTGIALGPSGNIFVTGQTTATSFPVVNAFRSTLTGVASACPGCVPSAPFDAFVTKFAISGTSLAFSTYLGSTQTDFARSLAVDAADRVTVVGQTEFTNFPVKNAIQATAPGVSHRDPTGFVTKFQADGADVVYSTYFPSIVSGVAANADNAFFVGQVGLGDGRLVTTPGALNPTGGAGQGFLARITDGAGPCTFSVQPASASAPSGGGPASFSVFAFGSHCAWNAVSNVNWIIITSGGSGSGIATVDYTTESNQGVERTGTVTVGGHTFTVSQAGTAPTSIAPAIEAHPANRTIAAGAGTQFSVTASGTPPPTYQWQVSANGGASFANLTNGGTYGGATTATLTLVATVALNGSLYRCIAVNEAGSATSTAALLAVTSAPVITAHPLNRSIAPGQNAQFSVAATGSPAPGYQWQVSTDGGISFAALANNGTYSGAASATLSLAAASAALDGSRYRCIATNATGSATSNAASLTVRLPTMSLDKAALQFGATSTGAQFSQQTQAQAVRLLQSNAGTATWTATPSDPWITVSPASGSGSATLTVGVTFVGGLPAAGTTAGTIALTFTNAGTVAATLAVGLTTVATGTSAAPAGVMDTPVDGSTGVTGSIAVTGWAIDDVEVTRVRILRSAAAAERTAPIFVGNAVFVDGARPDIALLNPTVPRSTRAGWGYLLLTNFLPDDGDGTFTLYAYADDADGHSTLLGSKTITCTNSSATRPFGAIDTPAQGDVIGGASYPNFGWVLARDSVLAYPPFGSVQVVIDGVFGAAPTGWVSRSDLTTLFPAATYAGVANALGVATLDTTALANGVHTIAWIVRASNGQADGIGSRYFTVANETSAASLTAIGASRAGGALTLDPGTPEATVQVDAGTLLRPANLPSAVSLAHAIGVAPLNTSPVVGRRGYDADGPLRSLAADSAGLVTVHGEELDRFELRLDGGNDSTLAGRQYAGYLRVGENLTAMPVGSHLDAASGVFTWQPGPGFLHTYDLVFVRWAAGRAISRQDVRIIINAKGRTQQGPHLVIDTPSAADQAGLTQPFVVAGWAIDASADFGTGVSTVHAWAYPAAGGPPVFVGAASYGGKRPDVAALFGGRFEPSGYGLAVDALPPGTYDLAVFSWSTSKADFLPARILRITVRE